MDFDLVRRLNTAETRIRHLEAERDDALSAAAVLKEQCKMAEEARQNAVDELSEADAEVDAAIRRAERAESMYHQEHLDHNAAELALATLRESCHQIERSHAR